MKLIDVDGLSRIYEKGRGLLPVSFGVEEGELIAVVGHNGAGKSTLLKLLAGWLIRDTGEVRIHGIKLDRRRALTRVIGFVPENPNLFDLFSVEYNLALFARLFQVQYSRVEEILDKFNLQSFRHSKVLELSKGLQQRVSIGRSLIADPPILLLDEPTSGLDFEMTREIYLLLRDIHARGKTILFTSHRPEEIKSLATRIMVIHQGCIVFDGDPAMYFESFTHQTLYL
jgi:ABC-2 type transport system ATP-binding protein